MLSNEEKSSQTPRSKATSVRICICLYPAFPHVKKEITTATEIHTVLMCQALWQALFINFILSWDIAD